MKIGIIGNEACDADSMVSSIVYSKLKKMMECDCGARIESDEITMHRIKCEQFRLKFEPLFRVLVSYRE